MNAYFNFLNSIQVSGVSTSHECIKYLQEVYGLSRQDAVKTYSQWSERKEEETNKNEQ